MTSHSPSGRSPKQRIAEGHAALELFQLARDRIHLNHGSYGAVPRTVQAAQERWRARLESDPTSFLGEELPELLRNAAGVAASAFGGNARDWVFCENATAAVNGVLASFPLAPGDEILTTSHAYGAVLKAMRLTAARRGASLKIAEIPESLEGENQVADAVARSFTDRTRLLVIDHITSAAAIVFPIVPIVRAAKAAGIAVLVDGAHAPGHIPLNVPALGADWYTGNAHKWLFAPRGCGLLWTAPNRQASTYPAVLSHGTDAAYTDRFDWIGTRDPTPWLCFETGLAFHEEAGGPRLMARNKALSAQGAAIIAEKTGTPLSVPESMRCAMTAIPLGAAPSAPEIASKMRKALTHDYGIVAPVYVFGSRLWLRISAQLYNEPDDYIACAEAIIKLRASYFPD